MDVLVVSACSGAKQFDDVPIGCQEIDSTDRDELLGGYPDYVAPVAEMYTGDEHEHVRRAVANLRMHADVSWRIVSAGYGLLAEDEEIVAYDCTFSDIDSVRDRAKRLGHDPEALTADETRRAVGRKMNLPEDLRKTLDGYDLAFVVLGQSYLVTVSEVLSELPDEVTVVAFASKGAREYIGDAHWLPATGDVRAALGTKWFSLKGELLGGLSESVDESELARIAENPETAKELIPAVRRHFGKD